jgi:hypothetical protein
VFLCSHRSRFPPILPHFPQLQPLPVIGFLHSEAPGRYTSPILRAFRQGLSESGHVEGRNVAIEYRWAESRYDRLPELAADLVRRGVNVVTANGPAIQAAKTATTTIPIVFFAGGDPVKLGLVTSLARPGGNLTGVTNLGTELGPKRLELLHELAPTATSVAVLVNPTYPDAVAQSEAAQAAAHALSLRLYVFHASTERESSGFQSASGESIQQDLTLSAFTAATITSTGHLSTLMASGPLTNVCSRLRQKNPAAFSIYAPSDWTAGEAANPHVPLAEVIEVIVRSYRLDSEQFRSAPRTCWPLCGRLSVW